MFQSTKFQYTRGNDRGMNMDIGHFANQFEETEICERIDQNDYNRTCLKNYGPDRILFPHEEPRRNTFSRQIINLHTEGAFDPTMPWRNDDFDLQFHDHDPRGYLEEQPWKKYRENNEPKLRQRLFGADADYSIPGDGIAPVDMVNRINTIRREMKSYMPWFEESLDNIVTGRSGMHFNTPNGVFGGGQIDMVIPEDSSTTVDPTILDSLGRQNVNRMLSNNLHMGSKYFTERTIPDHVVPAAGYGFLFKSYAPLTHRQRTNLMLNDQPIRTLDNRVVQKRFMQLLNGNNVDKTMTEQSRFNKMYETQEANKHGIMLNRDIMALMGLTAQEIKYINSMESTNREATRQCLANVVDMVVALDKLPPNAKLDIRNRLLEARTPEFMGGTCKLNNYDQKYRGVLESRGKNNVSLSEHTMNGVTDNKWGQSVGNQTSKHGEVGVNNHIDVTGDGSFGQSKLGKNFKGSTVLNRGGHGKKMCVEPTASYSRVFSNRSILREINTKLPTEITDGTYMDSNIATTNNKIFDHNSARGSEGDTDFGSEHMVLGELKSYNDHHLIPKQYKR